MSAEREKNDAAKCGPGSGAPPETAGPEADSAGRSGDRNCVSRILIVRLSAIGDGIHALPVLNALRAAYPRAFIGWAAHEALAGLLRGHPQLDAIHLVPRNLGGGLAAVLGAWRSALNEIRAARYDTVLDLQGLTKSGLVAWGSGSGRRIGFGGKDSRELNALFMTERIVPSDRAVHVVDRNLEMLRALGIERPEVRFVLGVFDEEGARMAGFLDRTGASGCAAVMSPGAGWETKRWPPARYGALAARLKSELGMTPILVWAGAGEKAMCEEAAAASGGAATIAPQTGLRELKELLARSRLFVGGDTGPLHLAAALGIPCVGIYGSSDEKRNGPYGGRCRIVSSGTPCRPCWKPVCPLSGADRISCMSGVPE
ncbi:MAG: glycosyltransferase family 9 protein, partial [Planctomycetota bacterium]|nr:glycosyltransferase family 9 protein [Planctomycetota bacterium]